MPRPKHDRHVADSPRVSYFKPQGIPMVYLEEARLSVEGLEALRLADFEGLGAAEAAGRMRVSRHTFGRVLAEARRVVARALVEGLALRIEGGQWVLAAGRPAEPNSEGQVTERPCAAAARPDDEHRDGDPTASAPGTRNCRGRRGPRAHKEEES